MVSEFKSVSGEPESISAAFALRRARLAERRRETRYPTQDAAEVEVRHGEILRMPAMVVDVSRSGLRLELPTAVGRGEQVKINLPRQVVILGEVRYCRRAGMVYHAGVLILDVFQAHAAPGDHISADELSFFLVGKGLAVADIIRLREHLIECEACRIRLGETDAKLNPAKRRKT
jgi:PilZ domain